MESPPSSPLPSSSQHSNDESAPGETGAEVSEHMNSSDIDIPDIDPGFYFHNFDLYYFASEPLRMVFEHKYLMELCLENNNPQAHYIEGINQFFFHKRPCKGLNHLRKSSHGHYDYGTYLCALLLLAQGNLEEGKQIFDKLDWQNTLSNTEHCWRILKKTLSVYPIPKETRYTYNMERLQPPTSCESMTMDHQCTDCFYFNRLELFVYYIKNR